MNKILVFAGTIEGRNLAEYLGKYNIEVHVCVATEYGEKLLLDSNKMKVSNKRLNLEEIKSLLIHEKFSCVIDATHPYAIEVTQNILKACNETGSEYIRLHRESSTIDEDCLYVNSIEEAVEVINDTQGKVLLTTGSKDLKKFNAIKDYHNRLVARVLSTKEVVEECQKIGFEGKNLICMQGPFSEELNYAMIKQVDAKFLVTKESGAAGGFEEKLSAAKRAGIKVIVIGRPSKEEGLSYPACLSYVQNRFSLPIHKEITLVGIGMGSFTTMTQECISACRQADVIIGAQRVLDSLKQFDKPMLNEVISNKIVKLIKEQPEYQKVVVALSGDIGFYSGAKRLCEELSEFNPKLICGISSIVYFASKLRMSWEDIKLISTHGREANYISAIKKNKRTFMLLGKNNAVSVLAQTLIENHLEGCKLFVGENLSYENEQISQGSPVEFVGKNFDSLCVVIIENTTANDLVITHGISDNAFIRGEVPMTKEEIRTISLSKLRLTPSSVIYDIGAGTGSVSLEMAIQADEGHVYAFEKNEKGIALIHENKLKFGVTNMTVVHELAPLLDDEYPNPTHAFIGGSSGNMKQIMQWLFKKNPKMRIVINTVTLESLGEAMTCIKEMCVHDVEITQVSISKSKEMGKYHLMTGLNPVTIISLSGGLAYETT